MPPSWNQTQRGSGAPTLLDAGVDLLTPKLRMFELQGSLLQEPLSRHTWWYFHTICKCIAVNNNLLWPLSLAPLSGPLSHMCVLRSTEMWNWSDHGHFGNLTMEQSSWGNTWFGLGSHIYTNWITPIKKSVGLEYSMLATIWKNG